MGKPFKKQSSEKYPAREKFVSRQTQASILTGTAHLQQGDKEEEKPWYKRTPVIVALIPVLGGLLIFFFPFVLSLVRGPLPPRQLTFAGRVVDEKTSKVIRGAKVGMEAKSNSVDYTDSEGVFSFNVDPDVHQIKIRVDAEGYIPLDRRINATSKNELEEIRLTPRPIIRPSPTVTPGKENQNQTNQISKPPHDAKTPTAEEQALKDLHSQP